jgi:hypothetical protein
MLAGVAGTASQSRWDDDLLALIRATEHLCLQVDDPGWENARGYLFDEPAMTLYFPVAKKYLTLTLSQYDVIIWSQPRVVVRGELQPATSEEDTATQLSLARGAGMDANKARYMLLDQRTQKARRTRYKLIVRDIARADALGGRTDGSTT